MEEQSGDGLPTKTRAGSTTMTHEPKTPISKVVEQSQEEAEVEGHRRFMGTPQDDSEAESQTK